MNLEYKVFEYPDDALSPIKFSLDDHKSFEKYVNQQLFKKKIKCGNFNMNDKTQGRRYYDDFLKWFVPLLAFVAFIGFISYGASIQNITTRSLAETEVVLETAHIGAIRTNLNELGQSAKDALYIDKRLVENLLAEIAATQKILPTNSK